MHANDSGLPSCPGLRPVSLTSLCLLHLTVGPESHLSSCSAPGGAGFHADSSLHPSCFHLAPITGQSVSDVLYVLHVLPSSSFVRVTTPTSELASVAQPPSSMSSFPWARETDLLYTRGKAILTTFTCDHHLQEDILAINRALPSLPATCLRLPHAHRLPLNLPASDSPVGFLFQEVPPDYLGSQGLGFPFSPSPWTGTDLISGQVI